MDPSYKQVSSIILMIAVPAVLFFPRPTEKVSSCSVSLVQADVPFARILNCDLREFLEAGEAGENNLRNMMWKHGVLVFPGQHKLTPSQEVAINRLFKCHDEGAQIGNGWSVAAWKSKSGLAVLPSQPEILCQGNAELKDHHGVTMKLTQKLTINNEGFHSDAAHHWQTGLPALTSMFCLKAPLSGGETSFADTRLALARASPDVARLARRLRVHYVYDESVGLPVMRDGIVRVGREGPSNSTYTSDAMRVVHPLVRKHPETGEEAVYISTAHIDHMEAEGAHGTGAVYLNTSAAYDFVETLIGNVTKAPLVYSHVWREGDFVIWDNRITAHSPGAEMTGVRLHHRVRLTGSSSANRDLQQMAFKSSQDFKETKL